MSHQGILVFLAEEIEGGDDRLAPEDFQRAAGMASKRRRREFVSGRLLARQAMQIYGGDSASEWRLHVRSNGALRIASTSALDHVLPAISLSHSHGLVTCVLGETLALGVDVELPQPRRHLDELATHILHPQEWAEFSRLEIREKTSYFYAKWVLKEALGKALGYGLSYPMQECLIHEGRLAMAAQEWVTSSEQWSLWQTTLSSGHHLGLAWLGKHEVDDVSLRTFKLEI